MIRIILTDDEALNYLNSNQDLTGQVKRQEKLIKEQKLLIEQLKVATSVVIPKPKSQPEHDLYAKQRAIQDELENKNSKFPETKITINSSSTQSRDKVLKFTKNDFDIIEAALSKFFPSAGRTVQTLYGKFNPKLITLRNFKTRLRRLGISIVTKDGVKDQLTLSDVELYQKHKSKAKG